MDLTRSSSLGLMLMAAGIVLISCVLKLAPLFPDVHYTMYVLYIYK